MSLTRFWVRHAQRRYREPYRQNMYRCIGQLQNPDLFDGSVVFYVSSGCNYEAHASRRGFEFEFSSRFNSRAVGTLAISWCAVCDAMTYWLRYT